MVKARLRRSVFVILGMAFCLIAQPLVARAADTAAPVVFAAASLKNALDEVIGLYAKKTGVAVRANYGASSLLARQIENGAGPDLFLSADVDWMDELAAKGLVARATRRDLLTNHLALIAPVDSKVTLKIRPNMALAKALGDGKLALAGPDVPAGRYARQSLGRLGVLDQVQGHLVNAESVRAALLYVARGEAALGVVYDTDAGVEPRVKILGLFPDTSHAPILYPAALLAGPVHPGGAAFLGYLEGDEASAVFRRYGFIVLAPPRR